MPDDAEKSKYIPMYYSYIEQLGLLSLEQVGALVMALLVYGRDGTQPDFPKDGNVYMAFSFIADNSMRAEIRRQEIVEKRREAGRIRAASAEKMKADALSSKKPAKNQHFPANPAPTSKSSYTKTKTITKTITITIVVYARTRTHTRTTTGSTIVGQRENGRSSPFAVRW
ncbi:MAG: DUF6291 domain-containing protein [Ruthenibacterium lactatiformans]